jgi:hypothetical protein
MMRKRIAKEFRVSPPIPQKYTQKFGGLVYRPYSVWIQSLLPFLRSPSWTVPKTPNFLQTFLRNENEIFILKIQYMKDTVYSQKPWVLGTVHKELWRTHEVITE